jgi:EAL domain-containing protein (putative c-di-GMP-specific phosphodiesterase class I)
MTPTPRESDELHLALDRGEVRPWYQPIMRLATAELVGFEALARWHRPSGLVELPGAFIGLAEETGLVTRLDQAILDGAACDLAGWRETRPDLRISVNLSGRHLDEEGWVDDLHALVTRHAVPPANLDIELTESARPRDLPQAAQQLSRLRDLGYAVWFDDFGTGWSELTHLVDVPVDGIKIDRFFTERLGGRADAVVRALLGVAADLGLATTIEGVATQEQADRALELGCDLAQGYLWSPPLSRSETEALLAGSDPS